MNLGISKFLTAAVLTTSLTGLQGCTDEEVAAGIGLIAIGVGIGIIADGDHHGGHHGGRYVCRGGYVTRCNDYRDYYGIIRRECREFWDSCAHREYRPYATGFELQSVEMTDVDPQKLLLTTQSKLIGP